MLFDWFKNNQKLESISTHYKIENSGEFSVFSISNVSKIDTANYSCVVSNAFGTDSQTVIFSVRGNQSKDVSNINQMFILCPTVPPTWVKEPEDVRVRAGEDIKVECIADGLPKPVTKWISSKGLSIAN